jgi:UDP-N-acetylglucosamine--N-acetylmuramyl-(pentapeptide) pyrophosphoryl-undecaprenol N-acetylglucosamine transferase
VYWVSGNYHFKELSESIELSGLGNRVTVVPFTNQMHDILNAADIVVSRTGATSLAELATLQKATILVPNPLLTGGHQVVNAKAYQDKNAAIVLQEHDLKNNPKLLSITINELLNNEDLKKSLQDNIKQFAVPNSAEIIASLILNVGSRQ